MHLNIAYLYYDLTNYYGEFGNIKSIQKHLKEKNIQSNVDLLTIDSSINFNKYDIFYIGNSTNNNKKLVLNDILKYKDNIKKVIDAGKLFIVTGNAIELFGKRIVDKKEKINCLNIFDYETEIIENKIIGKQLYQSKIINKDIIGYQNRNGIIKKNKNHLFKVINGTGSDFNDNLEGYVFKNFYATYLIGPLFIKNPYLIDKLLDNYLKDLNIRFKKNKKDFIDFKNYNNILKEQN